MKYASHISESIHAPEELKTSLTRRIEKRIMIFTEYIMESGGIMSILLL